MYASQKSGLAAFQDELAAMDKGKGQARIPGIQPMNLAALGASTLDTDVEDADYSAMISPVTPASCVRAGWEKDASCRAALGFRSGTCA